MTNKFIQLMEFREACASAELEGSKCQIGNQVKAEMKRGNINKAYNLMQNFFKKTMTTPTFLIFVVLEVIKITIFYLTTKSLIKSKETLKSIISEAYFRDKKTGRFLKRGELPKII